MTPETLENLKQAFSRQHKHIFGTPKDAGRVTQQKDYGWRRIPSYLAELQMSPDAYFRFVLGYVNKAGKQRKVGLGYYATQTAKSIAASMALKERQNNAPGMYTASEKDRVVEYVKTVTQTLHKAVSSGEDPMSARYRLFSILNPIWWCLDSEYYPYFTASINVDTVYQAASWLSSKPVINRAAKEIYDEYRAESESNVTAAEAFAAFSARGDDSGRFDLDAAIADC